MPIRKINGVELWQSELLLSQSGIVHGFTCRSGGVSEGEYASLSLSPRRGDDPDHVRQNEKILCKALGFRHESLSSGRQEHTDEIAVIDKTNLGAGVSFAWDHAVDALITLLPEAPLIAYAADCVPILLYAPDIRAVAAIHSGWRGTALNIAGKTAERLIRLGAEPKSILAAIGPAIGICCYETSADVAERFPESCRAETKNGKYMLDLRAAIELSLRALGIARIDNSAPCTKCCSDLFFSHRAQNGKSGAMGAVIEMTRRTNDWEV